MVGAICPLEILKIAKRDSVACGHRRKGSVAGCSNVGRYGVNDFAADEMGGRGGINDRLSK